MNGHVFSKLTLYVPRFFTTHGRLASRPNATVTFGIGSTNSGGTVKARTKKNKKLKLKFYKSNIYIQTLDAINQISVNTK